MARKNSGIRYLPGKRDLLIVSPHSPVIDGVFENDVRTGIIAENIQQALDCHAIINDLFFKPKGPITKSLDKYFLDLYRIDHSKKVSGYLSRIERIVKNGAKKYVVWVHGITDDVAIAQGQEHKALGLFDETPEKLHALIGYGQGGDPKSGETQSRYSARNESAETFRNQLCAGGLTTILTHPAGSNYRGRDAKRLNQWFNQQGYGFDRVESMHLDIREKGFRDSEANAVKTANIIATALGILMERNT
ncbi:MAG: hypothetical protein V2I56_17180 [Desulfobacteraceae bacterium]|jgi:hypothetical protein|nr:hypothetical protein [Desulfobacteraceae bacterium]